MLRKYPEGFKDDLSGYTGPPAHLNFEEGASPMFCKARSVPLALCRTVSHDLDQLKKQGSLDPTQHAEWATPRVLVRKKTGAIRLCGDYRCTVNAATKKGSLPLTDRSRAVCKR